MDEMIIDSAGCIFDGIYEIWHRQAISIKATKGRHFHGNNFNDSKWQVRVRHT